MSDDLFTIDVAAELDKLTTAQLLGAWQIPIELVAQAFAAGARAVTIDVGKRGLRLVHDGRPPRPEIVTALATLLDTNAAPGRRHRALVEIEAAGERGLVALAGLRPERLEISTPEGSLRHRPGATSTAGPRTAGGDEVVLEARLRGFPAAEARRSLRAQCRFRGARVRIDGHSPPPPFAPGSRVRTLDGGVEGSFAPLPGTGPGRAWLLVHGIVARALSLPSGPAIDLAIELAGAPELGPGGAGVSAAGERVLPVALADTIAIMLDEAALSDDWASPRAVATRVELLRAARAGIRAAEVLSTPLFPVTNEGRLGKLAALELARLTGAGGDARRIPFLERSGLRRKHDLAAACVVLDEVERTLLAEILGIGFAPVPALARDGIALPRLTRAWSDLARGLSDLIAWLASPRAAPELGEQELAPAELAFVATARAQLGADVDLRVVLVEGRGPVRKRKGLPTMLALPRLRTDVRSAIRAVNEDPTALYPALLALFGADPALPGALRRRFIDENSPPWIPARPRATSP